VVEIKNRKIKIDDIYQIRKYAELFNTKYSLLITTKEIPEEVKRLSKTGHTFFSGSYGYEKIVLSYFDIKKEMFIDWFEEANFLEK